GNAVVLRTGGAALGTVTALVDDVLRPALEQNGLPPQAVGLVRSPERAGAEALVSLPGLIPLVILRGSGASTAELARRAAVRGARGLPLGEPIGHEWASDPERVDTVTVAVVDGIDEALRIANEETSGLAAAIAAEDADVAGRFLDGYRGTAAFWNATTRFTDG